VRTARVTLIGATTENPARVNKALVSRSRSFRLQPLEADELGQLLERALADRSGGTAIVRWPWTSRRRHLLDVGQWAMPRSLLNALSWPLRPPNQAPRAESASIWSIAEDVRSSSARSLTNKQGGCHFDPDQRLSVAEGLRTADAALFLAGPDGEPVRIHAFHFFADVIAAGEDVAGRPGDPWWSKPVPRPFERVGLPEGSTPPRQRPSILAGARGKATACWAFSIAIQTVFVPPARGRSSTCARRQSDGQAYR